MIIGGHGQVALLTAPLLVRGGHHVTSVVRNPGLEADVAATGASVVVSDVERLDGSETRGLITGCDAIIWAAGAGGDSPERTYAVDRDAAMRFMDAALAEGVNRFVMLSYVGSGRDTTAVDSPFYAYADVRATFGRSIGGVTINSSADLAAVILDQAKVATVPGEAFGPSGYLRLSYALGDDDLREGLTRIQELLKISD